MSSAKRLLMVSFDAVGDQDLEFLRQMPAFSSLCEKGTLVREVRSGFVSNTYPTHTSIQTGVTPARHGIVDNERKLPGQKGEAWRFRASEIRVPTLSEQAGRAGLNVCTVLYPVTGGANIRWNFPEIAGHLPTIRRAARTIRYGSKGFVLRSMLRSVHFLSGATPEGLDLFTSDIACSALLSKRPDLTMVHLLDVDATKHEFGPDTPEAEAALRRIDARLGEILAAYRAGSSSPEDDAVIVFSDHNCLTVHTTIDACAELRDAGFSSDDAYIHEAGGVFFLKIANPSQETRIREYASRYLAREGIDRMLTQEEMRISGAAQEFDMGFSASAGYSFGEKLKGQHGYTLDRERYFTFYLAAGTAVPAGQTKIGGSLLDICPLAVDLLGIPSWSMEVHNSLF